MSVRQGGSYVADPETGDEQRTSGTVQPTEPRMQKPTPAPDVRTAPDPGPAQHASDATGRGRRRGSQTQEG